MSDSVFTEAEITAKALDLIASEYATANGFLGGESVKAHYLDKAQTALESALSPLERLGKMVMNYRITEHTDPHEFRAWVVEHIAAVIFAESGDDAVEVAE